MLRKLVNMFIVSIEWFFDGRIHIKHIRKNVKWIRTWLSKWGIFMEFRILNASKILWRRKEYIFVILKWDSLTTKQFKCDGNNWHNATNNINKILMKAHNFHKKNDVDLNHKKGQKNKLNKQLKEVNKYGWNLSFLLWISESRFARDALLTAERKVRLLFLFFNIPMLIRFL